MCKECTQHHSLSLQVGLQALELLESFSCRIRWAFNVLTQPLNFYPVKLRVSEVGHLTYTFDPSTWLPSMFSLR
jgi:hypothetical protein